MPRTLKAEETRERILDAALRLFRERGFDRTTMRDVAAEAEVATGAAYYYFRSKEELVMGFYLRTQDEARELIPDAIASTKDLRKRIRAIIELRLGQFAEHRALMAALIKAVDPKHPLSPFGAETRGIREESIDFFRLALDGATPAVPKDVAAQLPLFLWLYHMGVIAYWIYDDSPEQAKTRRLMDGTLDLLMQLIRLSSLPLMGPVRKRALSVLRLITD